MNNRVDLLHKDMSAFKVDMHKELSELRMLLIMSIANNKTRPLFAPTQALAPGRVVVDDGAPESSSL